MLYTKRGDNGTTKLFSCKENERISKSGKIFEVLGSLDELNSLVGYAKVLAKKEKVKLKNKNYEDILEDIQNMIFTLQASFAGSNKKLKNEDILYLENIIDGIEKTIPKINSFLISGHSKLSAFLDVLRSNTRKVERICVSLKDTSKYDVLDIHIVFLNRLSSFFYALERYVNFQKKHKEKSPKY